MRRPFADPDHQAIGHAFSPDGFEWHQSPGAAATSVIAYEDGAWGQFNVTFGKRERPHLYFSLPMRARCEAAARANVTAEIAKLADGPLP